MLKVKYSCLIKHNANLVLPLADGALQLEHQLGQNGRAIVAPKLQLGQRKRRHVRHAHTVTVKGHAARTSETQTEAPQV